MALYIDPDIESITVAMPAPPPLVVDTDLERRVSAMALRAWAGSQLAPRPAAEVDVVPASIPVRWGAIDARVYRAPGATDDAGTAVWMHGGGMVLGDLDKGEYCAAELALVSGLPVVSIDYRLAPEHPFPAGPQDCFDALCWLAENGATLGLSTKSLAVGGESAGGYMAAVSALQCAQLGGPPLAFALLAYPKLDFTSHYPSYDENAAVGIPPDMADFSDTSFLPDPDDRHHPLASLTLADRGDLARMPASLILTADADTLRDEGEIFGRRMRDAGAPATTLRGMGLTHGFLDFTTSVPAARVFAHAAYRALGDAVRSIS